MSALTSDPTRPRAVASGGDWLDRLLERAPLPPWGVAGAFAALVLAVVALAAALVEQPGVITRYGVLENRDLRLGLVITALAAYVPLARHYLLASAARNRAALRHLLGPGSLAAVETPLRWPRAGWACLFVVIVPLIALSIDREPGLYFHAGYWHVGNVWSWTLGAFAAWCLGRQVLATLAVSRQFSEIASALPHVDLLDRRWLAPFARQALFSSLLWLLVPALWAVNLVDAPFLLVVPVITLVCALIGTLALVLPTRGLRHRLQAARERELAATHAALRGDDASLADSLLAGRLERPGVADLVAWTRYVGELPTSPFTGASRLRFVLYLALPLGSWLGGALVDWLVGRLLS